MRTVSSANIAEVPSRDAARYLMSSGKSIDTEKLLNSISIPQHRQLCRIWANEEGEVDDTVQAYADVMSDLAWRKGQADREKREKRGEALRPKRGRRRSNEEHEGLSLPAVGTPTSQGQTGDENSTDGSFSSHHTTPTHASSYEPVSTETLTPPLPIFPLASPLPRELPSNLPLNHVCNILPFHCSTVPPTTHNPLTPPGRGRARVQKP